MFKIHSKYSPTGDQPEAIKKITDNINNGVKDQVLLGYWFRKNFYCG